MGFFSSRLGRNENEQIITASTTTTLTTNSDRGMVQVLRSRFYGKNKGKEREQPQTSFKQHTLPVAETPSSVNHNHNPISSSPLSSIGTSKFRSHGHAPQSRSRPSSPPSPVRSVMNSNVPPTTKTRPSSSTNPAPSKRTQTDNVTVTLAQRLNELGIANAEGLLNDDEYRLLRQNLFERFATSSTSAVPTENPVVPVAQPRANGSSLNSRPTLTSNFIVGIDVSRRTSTHSKSSLKSGVTNLFRSVSSRRTSNDMSDTSSILSHQSSASNAFKLPRILSKKSSNSSVQTVGSKQADAMSISSRRTGVGSQSDHLSPSGTRSTTGSIRRKLNPPSSYRGLGSDGRFAGSSSTVFDDDVPFTSQEISEEISAVEAEARRLMDAFHGLELTTMTKLQRKERMPVAVVAGELDGASEGSCAMTTDTNSQRKVNIVDNDASSMRSGTSNGTSPSMARSAYSQRKVIRTKSNLNNSILLGYHSRPGSLHRKNSLSSVASLERRGPIRGSAVPPVPALPSAFAPLTTHNGSAISLSRSVGQGQMSVVVEDETITGPSLVAVLMDKEIEDIRRRREDVQRRYEARLEYLRAKLKGAQLHEKLLSK